MTWACLFPHQANIRILTLVANRCGIPLEKVFLNIKKYGNTSSATIPTALDEAYRTGLITNDTIVLLTGFGGGFTFGSILTKFISFVQ